MDEKMLARLGEVMPYLLDNYPYIYFFLSVVLYGLGGMDEILKALMCLNVLDIIVCFLSRERSNKDLFKKKIKIYIVIMLGVMMDKLLGVESNPVLRARTCFILGYAYNEITSIVNTLCMDEEFFLPPSLRKFIKKLKDKEREGGDS